MTASAETNEHVRLDLQVVAQHFYFREAQLLDQRKYREWLSIFSEDVLYWAPMRTVRPPRERKKELSARNELAAFDEDYTALVMRVEKLETGRAWAEEPPSRTRHMVTNVMVEESAGGLTATSNFLVSQYRAETDHHLYVGERIDDLEVPDESDPRTWRVRSRTILFDHATLMAPSLSIFF